MKTEPVHYVILERRGVLAVDGADSRTFLQGLVSNDVRRVAADRAIYAALLTPQGKYLHDFFMVEQDASILIDCEAERLADLQRRLGMYKLRSDVKLTDRSAALAVAAIFGGDVPGALGLAPEPGAATAFHGGVAYMDPRLADAGARAVLPSADARAVLEAAGFAPADAQAYDRHRIHLGLADGSRDLIPDKSILLENGFDELNGIDWEKGCYMGQELTARTKYRGLVRKRLVPVAVAGPLPAAGTPVLLDDKEVGDMRSGVDAMALAFLRIEALEQAGAGGTLTAGEATLTPRVAPWAASA